MIFADLAAGDSVFLDANTFIYHFGPDPVLGPPCSQLLQRIENQELTGFTSVHVLAEMAHKLMTIEANVLFGWPLAGMADRLRRHLAEVQKLTAYKIALDRICQSRIQILEVPVAKLQGAAAICQRTGLLTNDALIWRSCSSMAWLAWPATTPISTGRGALRVQRPGASGKDRGDSGCGERLKIGRIWLTSCPGWVPMIQG